MTKRSSKGKDSWEKLGMDVAEGGPDTNPRGPRWSHIEWSSGPKPWCHCVMCRARAIRASERNDKSLKDFFAGKRSSKGIENLIRERKSSKRKS